MSKRLYPYTAPGGTRYPNGYACWACRGTGQKRVVPGMHYDSDGEYEYRFVTCPMCIGRRIEPIPIPELKQR